MSNKGEWGEPFAVMTITREDIVAVGFPRFQAALTDEEMDQISALVKASYDNEFFLLRLKLATDHVLSQRTKANTIGEVI